ncbi:hypothetical protein Goklo_010486 [Gossypium klotzschianum]|uniref:Uncharacterized protein n=1 Tax=Gossypium klotzschianum TaxID=34286 RepID=A0A7J8V6C1_9ROSI|nr:hypothetical protein [Gossypium klotzschianum]
MMTLSVSRLMTVAIQLLSYSRAQVCFFRFPGVFC